jgi:ATP-dependent Clp endopeptidase proteolytic subunit ClpP
MQMRNWYEIKASADKTGAEIYLYDEIGGWGISAKDFIAEVKALSGQPISLHIHSPGGSILDGHAIYNALLRHKGGLTIQIDGLAASMASVVAMAGRPVRMAENAFLMIHNPWSVSMGDSEQMRKDADLLDRMRDGLVNIYAQKTGKDEGDIEEMMDAETWLTAAEAKDMGFVDEITDRLDMAASFDLHKFSKVPQALVDNPTKAMSEQIIADLTAKHQVAAEQAQTNFAALQAKTLELDALKSAFDAQAADIVTLRSAAVEAKTKLEEYEAGEAERINAEAARAVAANGHPQLSIGSDIATNSTKTLLEQFEAIQDKEARFAFYLANKDALLAGN